MDPVCLSLVVLWGTGPAPAFRPVAEIRMVTNLCLLAHYAWDEDQEGLGSGPRATLDQACYSAWIRIPPQHFPCTRMAAVMARRHSSGFWGRLCVPSPPAGPSHSGLVPRKEALQLPHFSTLSVTSGSSTQRGPSSWRGRASQASHTDQLGAHRSSLFYPQLCPGLRVRHPGTVGGGEMEALWGAPPLL